MLLDYLIRKANAESRSNFHFIVPEESGLSYENTTLIPQCSPIGNSRQLVLDKCLARFNPITLLCFGNLPPGRKHKKQRIVTFFQNAHIIRSIDNVSYGLKDRFRYATLARYFRKRLSNTDLIVTQTQYIQESLCSYFSWPIENTAVFPFYDQALIKSACRAVARTSNSKREGFIYVSDDRPHKNHSNLLEAWNILSKNLEKLPKLKLTVTNHGTKLSQTIKKMRLNGIPVENLGPLPHCEALKETAAAEFAIYPSLLETIGLGMLEAAFLGCKVIASDSKCVNEVLRPYATFNPKDPVAIARSIEESLTAKVDHRSQHVLLENKINAFIRFLCDIS